MHIKTKKGIARVLGNFGTSFFAPLTSGNIAENIYDIGLDIYQILFIAFLSSLFLTGFVGFKEMKAWGERQQNFT